MAGRSGRTPRRPQRAGAAAGGSGSPQEFAGLGLTLGLAIALFAVGGNWLDERLGTKPLFVLLGVFLGFGGGFYHMYSRLVLRRRETADDDPGGDT